MKKILLILLVVSLCFDAKSQEKYAVLICGSEPDETECVMDSLSLWGALGDTIRNEFWNDTYLMYESLINNFGYADENVYVIYYNGIDFNPNGQADRYNSAFNFPLYAPITDLSATREHVEEVLMGFSNGSNGYPQLTKDDFLFIWTFGHGSFCGDKNPIYPCLLLKGNDYIQDVEFASLLDNIDVTKRAFWMQQCLSGSFANNLENYTTVFHSACQPLEAGTPADNLPDLENEVIDNEMYQHGEFNFHVFSSTNGETPYYSNIYNNQPLANADLNLDNIISFYESWIWERDKESKPETPLFSDLGNIASQTSLEYPTLLTTDIPAASNITHRGLIGISKDIHVPQGSQLTIHDNAVLHLVNEANLIVDQGATLIIGDNVTITGTNSNNELIVEGNITIGENVVINSQNNVSWNIYLKNESQNLTLLNTEFTDCSVDSWCNNFTLTNGTITGCKSFSSHRGIVTITNTDILKTEIYLENEDDNDNFISLINNDFSEGVDKTAIHIWNYRKYEIEDNTIDGFYDGIKIMQSGYGTVDKYRVTENTITNCAHSGIIAYGSRGVISNNHISDNMYGVWLGDHCSFRVSGNINALNNSQTQEILDNSSYELTSTTFSFPHYFYLNRIFDEDNAGAPLDPMIYHRYDQTQYTFQNDVRYNCWGTFFNPYFDFYPTGYTWQPEWCPPYMAYPDNGIPGAVYDSCQALLVSESYNQAKTLFQSLINTYPQSIYSMAALHELFALENNLTSDFAALKSYYENNTVNQNNTILSRVAEHLALKCDIKEENWSIPISYYDSIITNPPTYEDSLFAVLNLNYVNFMMRNSGNKSGQSIMNSSYIKKDIAEFKPYCDEILSLIPPPAEKAEEQNRILSEDRCLILETVPNPASNFTSIKYQISEDADISLFLYDNQGKRIKTIPAGTQSKGINFIKIETSDLPEGMYFYTILLDGIASAKEKLLIVK
ncbi:MAG: T9SS type A sorting domain-containing protein [Bacteroidales bacterium]|nr:T9SS type A sorting domain-containing protein [Bacteroidales bacterium]